MIILSRNQADPVLAHSRPRRFVAWWWGYALSLVLPLATLGFCLTGPHSGVVALLWTLPVWGVIAADRWGPAELRTVPASAPRWFFDGLLYAAAVLQWLNLIAMGHLVSRLSWVGDSAVVAGLLNLLAIRILVGTNACCSVFPPAHELIHRRRRWQRRLGRLMLMTVFYDHFHVAHRLGHHARLGRPGDPSTAACHESYPRFLWRSVVSQWRVAWRHQPRTVIRGLLLQVLMAAAYAAVFGALALFMWGYVNVVAVRLLEAVNYFQHFGLSRASGLAGATAWRCPSAVSLFLFMGLSRHADHHRRPWVNYPDLRELGEGPCLPLGYLGMAIWVKNASETFREWARAALRAGG